MVSNGVFINGYQIGSVYEIENENKDLKTIVVGIKLKDNYNIPNNSLASIADNPLGSPKIDIKLGNSTALLKTGDYINSENNLGLMGVLANQLTPVTDNLKSTLHSLDSALKNVNSIFDPAAKNNLQSAISNITKITETLAKSAVSLDKMLEKENGSIAKSMDNVNVFTKNLANQNEKINATLDNVQTTTKNLSEADIKGTVEGLNTAITTLNTAMGKLNSNNGSLGLLMNDKTLYNNLTNTVRSANILMDDLRKNPKRYVSISVFGKKEKTEPLMAPLDYKPSNP
jgi:phospholipid/cholesterol/gamma-HCH transport system substrate-binding protein